MSLISMFGIALMLPMGYVVGVYLGTSFIEAWKFDKKMVVTMVTTYLLFILGAILIIYGKK